MPGGAATEIFTTIEMRVAAGRGLLDLPLGWGPDVEVLEPPELREEVAEAHRRAQGTYLAAR